ncbi:hypothetical protein FWC63_01565 [Candidatus Saccharibacteria bacterium]|nr:hypothetical protein [Candidatus Saccharibacteria bacterium]
MVAELLKKELAKLSRDTYDWENGYLQLRRIAEIIGANDALMQVCLDQFAEFPVEAIYEELVNSGLPKNKVLAMAELLRLREATQTDSEYWSVIYSQFLDDSTFGALSIVRESVVQLARHHIHHRDSQDVDDMIYLCFGDHLYKDDLNEIIDLLAASPTTPNMQKCVSRFKITDGDMLTYELSDDGPVDCDFYDVTDTVNRLRKACDLPPLTASANAFS